MKRFGVVPFLNCARFFALPANALQNAKATSQFSIAAQSSERHSSVIADDRNVFKFSASSFCTACGRFFQSRFPAEVC